MTGYRKRTTKRLSFEGGWTYANDGHFRDKFMTEITTRSEHQMIYNRIVFKKK